MARTWQPIYDDSKNIDPLGIPWNTMRCISLLKLTSPVHNRDFPLPGLNFTQALNLRKKINNVKAGRNWMKVHTRFNDALFYNDIDIVIVYHLVKHKGKHWTISVGFDQSLLPAPDPLHPNDPNDPANDYVVFAKMLNNIIQTDLASFTPAATKWYSIDDVGTEPDGSEPVAVRRSTRIGELGYIAENNADIKASWTSIKKGKKPKPGIPGWGKNTDTEICLMEITV